MDILLIAVIFIIILAIAALFGLKHLQAKKNQLPKTPSLDKYLKVKKAEPAAPVTSTAITDALGSQPSSAPAEQDLQTTHNELSDIDVHIQNQDYDNAIHKLKRILMTNPHHSGAMLKLLQVYGITKKYNIFNQLHQKIQEVADQKTIAEANFLKTLIDDEIANQTAQNTPKTPEPSVINFDTIEFAQEGQTPSTQETIKPTATPSDIEFDFDTQNPTRDKNGYDLILDEPEPIVLDTPIATPTKETGANFDDLEFDLGNTSSSKTISTTNNSNVSQTQDNQNIGNIFDLSNPRKFTGTTDINTSITEFVVNEPAQSQKPTSNNTTSDDFNFDLDLDLGFENTNTQTSSTSNHSDFELEFETDTTKADNSAQDLTFDLDLDLGFENTNTQTSSTSNHSDFELEFETDTTKADNSAQDLTFDLGFQETNDLSKTQEQAPSDELSFSPSFDTSKQDTKTANDTSADDWSVDFGELSLDIDNPSVAPQQSDHSNTNTNTQDVFEFTLEIEPNNKPDTQDTHVLDLDSLATQTKHGQEQTVITAKQDEPELSFNPLDNAQVTLNLAKQYLRLGEYDSAKRLLDEVAQTGNDDQKQSAQMLIARLG